MPTSKPRPGGRESVLAAIAALPASKRDRRPNAVRVTTDFLSGAYGIVAQAALARRMSVASYMRRAAYAMACHDLGLPLSDAFTRDPRVSRETGFLVEDPDGDKFGDWEIDSLVGEGLSSG